MIEFLNDEVRKEFHLLPIDRQREMMESGARFAAQGKMLKILHVDRITEKLSEISVRIYEKFNKPA